MRKILLDLFFMRYMSKGGKKILIFGLVSSIVMMGLMILILLFSSPLSSTFHIMDQRLLSESYPSTRLLELSSMEFDLLDVHLLTSAFSVLLCITIILLLIFLMADILKLIMDFRKGSHVDHYLLSVISSKNKEAFLGDLLEMKAYMKESGISTFNIWLFTWKSIFLFNTSHLILKLKERLGLSPTSASKTNT